MIHKESIQELDASSIPLTRISWEPDVTEKLEAWTRQTAIGNYQDLTPALETEFEQRLNRLCIAVSSGTAALHLALRLLNLKPGTEVIIPTLTYAACANVVLYEGLKPVFCDADPQTWCLDAEKLNDLINKRHKTGAHIGAMMTVHLYGQACSMREIQEVCLNYGIPIIEDVAQALGGTYGNQDLGSIGDYACFSFNANKVLSGMGGGLLALRNAKEKESVRNEIRHGRLPFEKGVAQYVHQTLGFNYQISGYSSALIHFQLPYLEQRLEQKKALFDKYKEAFKEDDWLKPQGDPQSKNHARWLSSFEVAGRSRDSLCRYLNENGIDARPAFKPLHTQPAYQGATHDGGQNAERIANNGICLPSPCNLTEQEQEKVIKTVERWHIR